MKPSIDKIFKIKTLAEFKLMAFAVFDYQYNNNEVYREYIISLKVNTNNIKELDQIPFLPIEFFKTHSVISDVNENDRSALFTSSGDIKSKHYVSDVSIYENSYRKGFEYFYGNIKDYIVLALLPSYLERSGSSLIYMAEDLIKRSKNSLEGFYLNNYNELKMPAPVEYACDNNSVIPYSLCICFRPKPLHKIPCNSSLTISERFPFIPPVSITIVWFNWNFSFSIKSSNA